jgi:hypothetical protein
MMLCGHCGFMVDPDTHSPEYVALEFNRAALRTLEEMMEVPPAEPRVTIDRRRLQAKIEAAL